MDFLAIVALGGLVVSSLATGMVIMLIFEVHSARSNMRESVYEFGIVAKKASEANVSQAKKLMSIDERLVTIETRVDFLNAQTTAWKGR